MKILVGQINPTVGDLKNNTTKILSYIKRAKEKKADLVVFPELRYVDIPLKTAYASAIYQGNGNPVR